MKKTRIDIPEEEAIDILFWSDRTCCICRDRGKQVQIHHIDNNPANNKEENLAVLCLDCHNETHIQGGFSRKLNPGLVTRYRNDWLALVSQERTPKPIDSHQKGKNITTSQSAHPQKLAERQIDEIDEIERNICTLTGWLASYNFSSLDQNEVRSLFKQTHTMGMSLRRYDQKILGEFYDFMNAAGILLDQGGRMKFETYEENMNAVSRLDASCDKLIEEFRQLREG